MEKYLVLVVIIGIGIVQFASMMVITGKNTEVGEGLGVRNLMSPDPMCVITGNISCFMHCNGMGYLSGYCDTNDTCCCLDDVDPPLRCQTTTITKVKIECNPEEKKACKDNCTKRQFASHYCTPTKCHCS